jgi:hypothetical protein
MRIDMHTRTADTQQGDVERVIAKVRSQRATHVRNFDACSKDPYDSIAVQTRDYWKQQIAIDDQQLVVLHSKLQEFTGDGSWSPAPSTFTYGDDG